MAKHIDAAPKSRNKSSLAAAAPWLTFLLVALLAFVAFTLPARLAAQRRQAAIAANKKLSLPDDYPLAAAPIYAGAKVKTATKSSTTSKDDQPMEQWDVTAESDAQIDPIYNFYLDFCTKKDMLQTQMISIPTGHSMDYANEKEVIHVEIERHTGAKVTTIRITYDVLTKTG